MGQFTNTSDGDLGGSSTGTGVNVGDDTDPVDPPGNSLINPDPGQLGDPGSSSSSTGGGGILNPSGPSSPTPAASVTGDAASSGVPWYVWALGAVVVVGGGAMLLKKKKGRR